MTIREILDNFHKTTCQNLRCETNILEHSLNHILIQLRGTNQSNQVQIIPGYFFAYANSEVDLAQLQILLADLSSLSKDFLLSHTELIVNIITQIVAFSFSFFSDFLINKDKELNFPLLIKYNVCQIIVDPSSGFLNFAPVSPNNDEWHDPKHKFQFFELNSSDLQSNFGKSLTKIRNYLLNELIAFVNEQTKEISYTNRSAILVHSILTKLLSTIVPSYFNENDISCGFPFRPEILFSISSMLDQANFIIKPQSINDENSEIVLSWSKFYEEFSGLELMENTDQIDFPTSFDSQFSPILSLMTIFPMICFSTEINDILPKLAQHVVSGILGPNPIFAGFLIVWSQIMLYLMPAFSKDLFTQIFKSFELYHILSINQKQTLIHSISRFISILCCHLEAFLSIDDITYLHSFATLNLCSISPEIRYVTLKLLRMLNRYTSRTAFSSFKSIFYFFNEGSELFRQNYLKVFREHPVTLLTNILIPSIIPRIIDILISNNITMWNIVLVIISQLLNSYLDQPTIHSIKQFLINFVIKTKNNQHTNNEKISMILILTLLGECAQFPTDNENQQLLSEQIISESLDIANMFIDDFFSKLHLMFLTVDPTALNFLLSQCDRYQNIRFIVLIIYSFVLRPNFNDLMENEELYQPILSQFTHITENLFELQILEKTLISSHQHNEIIRTHSILVGNYLIILYSIFKFYEWKYKEHVHGLIQIIPFVVNTEQPCLKNFSFLFTPLINLTTFPQQTLYENHIHTFAVHALSRLVACIKISDMSLFIKQDFISLIYKLSIELPDILRNILVHHFSDLFSRFLIASLSPDGKPYFDAIASLFSLHPLEIETNPTSYILYDVWPSLLSEQQSPIVHKYLLTIYENCGTFLLCCLFYLSQPDKEASYRAFYLIVMMTPILAMYHFNGRKEYVTPLFSTFLKLVNLCGQSISNLQIKTIAELSEVLSVSFSFCLEQFLFDALNMMPKFDQQTLERVLFVITPWFDKVDFDMENRVISKETDLRFMRFSCYSFIDKLLSSIPQIDLVDFNSPSIHIWRSLVTNDSSPKVNIVPILISLMYSTENVMNHSVLQPLIRFLYRLQGHTVIDCLTSFLTFPYNFYRYQQFKSELSAKLSEQNILLSEVMSMNDFKFEDSEVFSSKNGLFTSSQNSLLFVLNELQILAMDSVVPIIPYLPIIFSYCLVNIDIYFDKITALTSTIFNRMKILIDDSITPVKTSSHSHLYNLITGNFQDSDNENHSLTLLSSFMEAFRNVEVLFKIEDLSKVQKPSTLKGSVPIPGTNLTKISKSFTSLFEAYGSNLAHRYEMQLMQWAMCCSDLKRATNALNCLQGSISMINNNVIGCFARSFKTVAGYAEYLLNTHHQDISLYTFYMRSLLVTLKTITQYHAKNGTLFRISSIFWISIEALNCGIPPLSVLFEAALELLCEFLNHPELFTLFTTEKVYSGKQFTSGLFWTYHEPWKDTFQGCQSLIFGFQGETKNFFLLIKTLHLLIQTNFPPLLSVSSKWYYASTLALLPWIWSVVVTDIKQYLLTTEEVQLMIKTKDVLVSYFRKEILDTKDDERKQDIDALVKSLITVVGTDDFGLYDEMIKLATLIVKLMDKNDLPSLANFFTSYLKYGPSFAKIPLYSIVAQIITMAPDSSIFFDEFVGLAKTDSNFSRRTYFELLHEKFDDHHNGQIKKHQFSFHHLKLFDRIVAILIPQTSDFDFSGNTALAFDELALFPPILPNDPLLLQNPTFERLQKSFKTLKIEPFCSWNEILAKMHTSLIDDDFMQFIRPLKLNFDPCKVLTSILDELKNDESEMSQSFNYIQDEITEDDQKNRIIDPYELIVIKQEMFIPSIEDANNVGDELFESLE